MPQSYLSEKFLAASRLALGLPPTQPPAVKAEVFKDEDADDYRAAVRRWLTVEAGFTPRRPSAPGPSAPRRSPPARSSQTYR
jgi:hypothetical protein